MSQRRPGALELTNPMSVYHNYYTLMLQKYQNHDMDVEPRHGRQKRGSVGNEITRYIRNDRWFQDGNRGAKRAGCGEAILSRDRD